MLRDQHTIHSIVYEAQDRVGGKSLTFERGDFLCEMGTCYATRGDRIARRWMKQLGFECEALGVSKLDGEAFMTYVNGGKGLPLPLQLSHYLLRRKRLLKRIEKDPEDREAASEAAMPILEWLRRYRLYKIERLQHRAMTVMGYGFLEETSTLQALRWVDWDLILSGAVQDLVTPVHGWSRFWESLALDLNVRQSSRVLAVRRDSEQVTIDTAEGSESFEHVVCAMALDDFCRLTQPTPNERFVNGGVRWGRYCTSLVAADWFTKEQTRGYSASVTSPAKAGRMLAARHEGHAAELGGDLYVCGQIMGNYSSQELIEVLTADIEADSGRNVHVVLQKTWKYFPQYKLSAIENGLLAVMNKMQGENRTWYTGATFSHEAVSKIAQFNARLALRIAQSAKPV